MEMCIRCRANSEEVRLFDAICEGKMEFICERCSIIENIPIIKKPNSSQLKDAESATGVYDRMKFLTGAEHKAPEDTYFQEDKLKELDENPELEMPEKEKLKLIDHFYWEIMKCRRRKRLSAQQLAKILGESEIAIQMIENGKLPENAEPLIRKLEQFFQTRLREISEIEEIMQIKKRKQEPRLLDEDGHELQKIPEEEPYIPKIWIEKKEHEIPSKIELECKIEKFETEKRKMTCEPEIYLKEKTSEVSAGRKYSLSADKDFDLKKIDPKSVTIAELKEIHKRKIEATKQERIEEQRKIEERQRILEATRERDRIKHEQLRQQKMLEKQEQEREKQKIIEQRKRELEQKRKEESKEIDRLLGGSELLEGKPSYENDFDEGL